LGRQKSGDERKYIGILTNEGVPPNLLPVMRKKGKVNKLIQSNEQTKEFKNVSFTEGSKGTRPASMGDLIRKAEKIVYSSGEKGVLDAVSGGESGEITGGNEKDRNGRRSRRDQVKLDQEIHKTIEHHKGREVGSRR